MVVVVVDAHVVATGSVLTREPQHHRRVNLPPFHSQHWSPGPQGGAQPVLQCDQRSGGQGVSPTHQHQIGGLQLLVKQILNRGGMIKAGIG